MVMSKISLLLLLTLCAPFVLAGVAYPAPNTNLDEDSDFLTADSSDLDFRRLKRSLTTICVEIKPSGPQEEPYFMCKGADLPPFQKKSNGGGYAAGYGSHLQQQYNSASGGSESPSYQPAAPATTPVYPTSDTYGGPGTNFQSYSKSYDKKPPASYAQNADSPYSSNGASSGTKISPAKYSGIRPQESYTNNAYNGQSDPDNSQKQSPAYQHTKAPSFPSYETATTPQYNNKPKTHDQQYKPLPDYESVYAKEHTPPQSASYTQPATGYGSSTGSTGSPATNTASHQQHHPAQTSYNNPAAGAYHNGNKHQSHGNHNGGYDAFSHTAAGAHTSEANYGAHHPTKSINTFSGAGGGAYVYPSTTVAHSTAGAQKSTYAQTIPYAHGAAAPTSATQSANRPTSAPAAVGNSAYVASAAGPTKSSSPASSYVRPSSSMAAGPYGRSMSNGDAAFWRKLNNEAALLGVSYQPPTSSYQQPPQAPVENYQAAPEGHKYQHNQPSAAGRYRSMIDEAVLGPHNWGLSPEELELFRSLPVDDPALGMAPPPALVQPRLPMEHQQQSRAMPAPHMDDPLMQQFYSTLHEPPLPAPFPAQAPIVGSKNIQASANHQSERTYSTYSTPPMQQSSCPTYPPPVASSYAPSTPPPPSPAVTPNCGSCGYYPSAPPPTTHQYVTASDYGTSYIPTAVPSPQPAHNCNSCGQQLPQHSFQPVFIALPCYGQPPTYGAGTTYNTASLPANQPTTYDPAVGMGNPMARLFGPFGPLASPLHPFGLMNPIGGLLSSPQQQSPSSSSQSTEADPPIVGSIQSIVKSESKPVGKEPTMLASMTTTTTTESPVVGAAVEFDDESPELFEEKSAFVAENSEELSNEPENNSEIRQDAEPSQQVPSQQLAEVDVVAQKVTTPPPSEVVAKPKPKNAKKLEEKLVSASQLSPAAAVPPNLEDESKKAYVTMLTAARTFSSINKSETQNAAAESKPPRIDNPPPSFRRVEKRQNTKAATGGVNPGFKRKYVQKLETDI